MIAVLKKIGTKTYKKGEITILYNKIKSLCKQHNITVTKLERILEFGNGTIHRWEKVQPSIDKAKKVADYFGLTVDLLISSNMDIPSNESLELVKEFETCTPNQKALIKCYISIIKNGQAV